MSKHFETIQQMEQGQTLDAEQLGDLEFRPKHGIINSDARERWANEEALRLVQQIFLLQNQDSPRVVVFAGVDHKNGCSQICASVAETLARDTGRSVCLLEANFRSPSLRELFGATNRYGLTDALLGKEPISSFTQFVTDKNVWLLSAGVLAPDSSNLLTSERLRARLSELREVFDFVIIDAPPLARYYDAVVLGQLSDGLVLILEADATRREAAAAVAGNLRAVKVPILAAVLNKRKFAIPKTLYSWL
jgi:capsular exopolysaccharide synthesis family protein